MEITRPSQFNKDFLFAPEDNASLIVFRIFFGLLLFLESIGAILTGWVKAHLIDPPFTFTYIGFEWLQPLPGNGMYYYYVIMGIAGLMIMLGYYYRLASFAFFFLWTTSYLMQKSEYNNHYYLLILLSLIMIVVPAADDLSLDSRKKEFYSNQCPAWCLLIFKVQFAIVYFYAGINKIYPGWLEGSYIGVAFAHKSDYPLIGPYLNTSWFKFFITYGGLFFDLLIIPALLFRRTRTIGFACLLFFHLFNSVIFQIGIFPYMMIAASVFYFPPEKIRSLFFRNRTVPYSRQLSVPAWGYTLPSILIVLYISIQAALPLRPLLYPGDSHWTEQGHRMSWRMMLRTKAGTVHFKVRDRHKKEFIVYPADYLNSYQARNLAGHPDMIWQFAQFLKKELKAKKVVDPEIYVYSYVSINGHPPRPLIDTLTDLGSTEWNIFYPSAWILPSNE